MTHSGKSKRFACTRPADRESNSAIMPVKHVTLHTDGGCHGNPGPGGWAAVLRYGKHLRELSGAEAATTNNRMELRAAIEALSALKEPCEVELFTDSTYVRDGISKWLPFWKSNGWVTLKRRPVKNEDLWRALDSAAQRHRIVWRWLKGHAGHPDNERCDQLAREAMEHFCKQLSPDELSRALKEFNEGQSEKSAELFNH
jgi:ribonuclease HI